MEYTQEEKLQIQGFRNGYFIASKSKAMQEKILKLHHSTAYLKSLIKGIEEFEKYMEIKKPQINKLAQRKAILKQITDREKEQSKDDFER